MKNTTSQPITPNEKPVYHKDGKYIDSKGNLFVWDGPTGKFLTEEESLANSREFLSKLGFNFDDKKVVVWSPTKGG